MKELFIKILRFLMFVLVVALGCIGYNIYEDTLAAVWIPVGVGLVVAVVTLPLYKKMDMADNDGAKGSEYIVSCGVRGCHQLFAFSGRELSDGGSCFDKGGDGHRT